MSNTKRLEDLFYAVHYSNKDDIETLLYNGVDINELLFGQHILDHPITEDYDLKYIEYLLNKGAYPNIRDQRGQHALYAASQQGYVDITEFLLKRGANPNLQDNKGNTALHVAVYRGGENPTEYPDNNFLPIGIQNYVDIIKLLVHHQVNINIQNNQGATPLFEAAAGDNYEAVSILLELGADPKIPNKIDTLPSEITKREDIEDLFLKYMYTVTKGARR